MFDIIWAIVRTFVTSLRSRRDLLLENLALRQQLPAFKARGKRPRIGPADRAFWVLLRRLWARWAHTLVIVKPDTVVRWHRAGFRWYWRWISRRRRRVGRRPMSTEIRELIRRMASENGWGAPRIHGELLMLGLDVSERTVSRYLQRLGRRPEARQSWLTFLHNHREAIAAMDLFVVFTVKFRLLYVLFVIRHGRRQIVHFNVTEHPTTRKIPPPVTRSPAPCTRTTCSGETWLFVISSSSIEGPIDGGFGSFKRPPPVNPSADISFDLCISSCSLDHAQRRSETRSPREGAL